MARHYWTILLKKLPVLALGRFVLKAILTFMAIADSLSPLAMAYATMVCPREKMPRSFCAKN